MKHEMISKDENAQAVELSDAALEKVAGGFWDVSGKEVDPNRTCLNYVCATCGGSRKNHAGNCKHPRLDCCGSCAKVTHDSGSWFCGPSQATK